MEALCIGLALLGLMYFAYRGWSIILIAPFFAGLAALASMFDILPVYSELYMTRLAEYVKTYYPVFLFGAVFAKLMEKGGLASAIAGKIVDVLGEKRAILAVLMGCGALTYYLRRQIYPNGCCRRHFGSEFFLSRWFLYLVHRKFRILFRPLIFRQVLGRHRASAYLPQSCSC